MTTRSSRGQEIKGFAPTPEHARLVKVILSIDENGQDFYGPTSDMTVLPSPGTSALADVLRLTTAAMLRHVGAMQRLADLDQAGRRYIEEQASEIVASHDEFTEAGRLIDEIRRQTYAQSVSITFTTGGSVMVNGLGRTRSRSVAGSLREFVAWMEHRKARTK